MHEHTHYSDAGSKVSLHSPGHISYWTGQLKTTPALLHEALKAAGPDVAKVRLYLAHREWRAGRTNVRT